MVQGGSRKLHEVVTRRPAGTVARGRSLPLINFNAFTCVTLQGESEDMLAYLSEVNILMKYLQIELVRYFNGKNTYIY